MFSRASRPASVTPGMSFIGPDVVITGNMEARGDIHVDGRVDGDIRCTALIQGDGGRIAGGIFADQARIAGLVDGSIDTRELLLSRTARVTGDVAYESLSIETGAQVAGNFAHRPSCVVDEGEEASPLKLIASGAE